MSISNKVCAIVAETLKVNDESISDDSGLGKTPNWDSLNHTKLVLELEDAFDVDFDFKELDKITTVAAIVSSLQNKGVED